MKPLTTQPELLCAPNANSYSDLLATIASFSRLFSDNVVPFVSYRIVEKLFCYCFKADNLSRSDTAFDARIGGDTPTSSGMGIGIKTFICEGNESSEKIAEFNRQYDLLSSLGDAELATEVVKLCNERIESACRQYNIDPKNIYYHIVARQSEQLQIFNVPYDIIDVSEINIHDKKGKLRSNVRFEADGIEYIFNRSKSTLFRKFRVPSESNGRYTIPVKILNNPIEIIEHCQLIASKERSPLLPPKKSLKLGEDFVILPLYGEGLANGKKVVYPRSGLNQWNATGRPRDLGEIYVRIPIIVHKRFPIFFPSRDHVFTLKTPTGESLQAKVCQDNSKAIMTNPNKALAEWLIKKFIGAEIGTIITYDMLERLGFDSVIIVKESPDHFSIDKAPIDSYEQYVLGDKLFWDNQEQD